MFCEECGTRMSDDMLFCPKCGTKVERGESAAQADVPPAGQTPPTAMAGAQEDMPPVGQTPPTAMAGAQGDMPPAGQTMPTAVAGAQADVPPAGQTPPTAVAGAQEDMPPVGQTPSTAVTGAQGDVPPAGQIQPAAGAAAQGSVPSAAQPQAAGAGFGQMPLPVPPDTAKRQKQPGRKSKLPFIIIGGVAGVAVLAALLFFTLRLFPGGGGGSSNDTLLYVKDESLYETSVKRIEPVELDEDAYEEEGDMPAVKYSDDGTYLFYLHGNSYDDYDAGATLSCINRKKKDARPEKVDSGIGYFDVTPDNRVVYIKNDSLYINDLTDKEKIDSDVLSFQLSEDGKRILWRTYEDGRLYVQDTDLKTDKEKIDSDVEEMHYVSDSFDRIVYQKAGSLYLVEDLGEKEKIAADVSHVASVVENGSGLQILYEVSEKKEQTMMDFVEDDLAESDAKITEPREEDYQTTRIVENWWGSREKVETSDEYYQKLEEYYAKLDRDGLREELSGSSFYTPMSELCLYDTSVGEATTVLEGYLTVSSCYQVRLRPMEGYIKSDYKPQSIQGKVLASCTYVSEEALPKVKLSQLFESGNWYSLEPQIEETIRNDSVTYLILGSQAVEILDEDRKLDRMAIDEEKNRLYAVTYEEGDEGAENYEIGELVCSGDEFGAYQKLYDDAYKMIDCTGGNIIYMKDRAEDGSGDLYYNDTRVDSDVSTSSPCLCYDGNVLYKQDMTEEGAGTIKLYDGKESKKIADDVTDLLYFNKNRIAVLTDYSTKSMRGDLKLYNGKELEKVDTDVISILQIYK